MHYYLLLFYHCYSAIPDNRICVAYVNIIFFSMRRSIGLQQLMGRPIHIAAISESLFNVSLANNNEIISSTFTLPSNFSLHIGCKIKVNKPKIESPIFTIRDWEGFNEKLFFNDIVNSYLREIFHIDVVQEGSAPYRCIVGFIHKHFSSREIRIRKRHALWMTD